MESYRIGAVAIIGAVLLRIACGSLPQKTVDFLSKPEVLQTVLSIGTGRFPHEETPEHQIESPPPDFPQTPVFSGQDADLVKLRDYVGVNVDVKNLLDNPSPLQPATQGPAVLILHAHATESYTYTGGYVEDTPYRTLNSDYNMLRIGQELTRQLEEAGISVLHDQTLHDYPSYNGSYANARITVSKYLEQYPSIRLVVDLHRDAVENQAGVQLAYATEDLQTAQLMLVVGTNHTNWQDNLSIAVRLQTRLEQLQPGICRPTVIRNQRFNQDLSPGAVLVEVGAAGNTQEQALAAVAPLTQAICDLLEEPVGA